LYDLNTLLDVEAAVACENVDAKQLDDELHCACSDLATADFAAAATATQQNVPNVLNYALAETLCTILSARLVAVCSDKANFLEAALIIFFMLLNHFC
jgi:hypothetical protein